MRLQGRRSGGGGDRGALARGCAGLGRLPGDRTDGADARAKGYAHRVLRRGPHAASGFRHRAARAGAAVTLTGGQVDGRTTVTDSAGRFAFADYPTCERESVECRVRRIRVEKPGYATQVDSLTDDYLEITPGLHTVWPRWDPDYRQIVLGHEWPRDPQFDRMRANLPVIEPLWLVLWEAERWPWGHRAGGYYRPKLMMVLWSPSSPWWTRARSLTHEYCHAHQDWVADPTGPSFLSDWVGTPQGQAYIAAPAADEAAGYPPVTFPAEPWEQAAEVCEVFYYEVVSRASCASKARRVLAS